MKIEKKLVTSFIEFLNDQIATQDSSDIIEGLEVAVQCLENAFSIETKEIEEYKITPHTKLINLFNNSFIKNEPVDPEIKQRAESLKNRGNDLMKSENGKEALEIYSKAIELDINDPIYYCNRAAAYLKLNQFDEAIKDCKKALELNPNYSKAYGRLGLAYISAEKYNDAEKAYKSALSIEPKNESYINNLKIVQEKLNNLGPTVKTEGDQNTTSNANGPDLGNLFGTLFSGGLGPTGGTGAPSSTGSQFDISSLLNNPDLINMASNLMTNPNVQSALSGVLNNASSGGDGRGNFDSFINFGQQLASQMQNRNPELINQLRNQFMNMNSTNNPNNGNNTSGSNETNKDGTSPKE